MPFVYTYPSISHEEEAPNIRREVLVWGKGVRRSPLMGS